MTQNELESRIRSLTGRIGKAKRSGAASEEPERLRLLRFGFIKRLVREFNRWTLFNAEGKTEFVDHDTWERRVAAWRARVTQPSTSAETETEGPPAAASEDQGENREGLNSLTELFGEPISIYTRAQALEDGVLVDVTPMSRGIFKIPVALTTSLWADLSNVPEPENSDSHLEARTREVLKAAAEHGRAKNVTDRVSFPLLLQVGKELKSLDLLAVSGPGDQGEHVLTIGFPGDF